MEHRGEASAPVRATGGGVPDGAPAPVKKSWPGTEFQEGAMMTHTSDRQELLLWAMLSIVGAILAVVGWYRWAI
jgi:hypothetical protein